MTHHGLLEKFRREQGRRVVDQLCQAAETPDGAAGLGQLIDAAAAEVEGEAKFTAPDWIPLFPDARLVEARDGRRWLNPGPQTLIDAFTANGADLMIDWDHAAPLANFGGKAPSAGWISELRPVGTYGLEGKVAWTPDGRTSVETRSYRFTSPWFKAKFPDEGQEADAEDGEDGLAMIVRVMNVALVNMPALRLDALTAEQQRRPTPRKKKMDKETLAALGLPETATKEQVLARVQELAVSSNRPDATAVVAKLATATEALATATTERDTARTALADATAATRDAEIKTALDQAGRDGKMPKSTRPVWEAFCKEAGGLDKFRAHMASIPKVIANSTLPGADPDTRAVPTLPEAGTFTAGQMTEQDHKSMRACHLTVEQFVKSRNHTNGYRRQQLED